MGVGVEMQQLGWSPRAETRGRLLKAFMSLIEGDISRCRVRERRCFDAPGKPAVLVAVE